MIKSNNKQLEQSGMTAIFIFEFLPFWTLSYRKDNAVTSSSSLVLLPCQINSYLYKSVKQKLLIYEYIREALNVFQKHLLYYL